MICPKCKGETRVIATRVVDGDGGVIRRRRACQACVHRFSTFESTLNPIKHRASTRIRKKRLYSKLTPEAHAALLQRRKLRYQARRHAAETGTPLADVLRAWAVPPTPSSPLSVPRP